MTDGGSSKNSIREFTATSAILKDDDILNGDVHTPTEMPERVEELNAIHSAIEPAARGKNPRNLFLYGKPGQGKTAGVKIKRQQFEEFARREGIDVTMVYIECETANKTYHVLTTAIKKLEQLDEKPAGLSLDKLYERLFDYMNEEGGTFIFILDEIDRIQDDEEDELNILYKLPRAYSGEELNENVRCSVIGISNDRRFKSNLSSSIKDSLYENEIDFAPYTQDELTTILYRRAAKGLHETDVIRNEDGRVVGIESSIISEQVIEKCAKHALRERGSARQAIDILGQAATIAHDMRAERVTEEHVEMAEDEVNKNYIKEMLADHTTEDLVVLCSILYLAARDQTPAETPEIHDLYSTYANSLDRNPLVQRRMRDRLQDLKTTGVIGMEKSTGGRVGGARWESWLKIPLEETVELLSEDEAFATQFEGIVKEVRAELR